MADDVGDPEGGHQDRQHHDCGVHDQFEPIEVHGCSGDAFDDDVGAARAPSLVGVSPNGSFILHRGRRPAAPRPSSSGTFSSAVPSEHVGRGEHQARVVGAGDGEVH